MEDALTPFIKIPIPGPFITLNVFQLTALYIATIYFDYLLFCRTNIPYQKLKTPLRIYHILLPFIFSPDWRGTITGFVAFPWLFASVGAYSAYKYKKQYSKENPMSFWDYLKAWGWETAAHQVQPKNDVERRQVTREGYTRLCGSLAVTLVGKYVVTPLLLDDPRTFATFKWYSLNGIYYGFLMGLKGYMLMNTNEIACALPQIILGIRTINCFNTPYLATSPKDFWGRRWNLIVRNLFHKQVFKNKSGNLAWNGFKAFVISASMHEIIMTFVSRTITFEQFSFFMLQGIFIFLQITLLPKNCILPKFICIIITLITISLTAQLFLLSFVRYPEVVHFLSSSSWI